MVWVLGSMRTDRSSFAFVFFGVSEATNGAPPAFDAGLPSAPLSANCHARRECRALPRRPYHNDTRVRLLFLFGIHLY